MCNIYDLFMVGVIYEKIGIGHCCVVDSFKCAEKTFHTNQYVTLTLSHHHYMITHPCWSDLIGQSLEKYNFHHHPPYQHFLSLIGAVHTMTLLIIPLGIPPLTGVQ